MATALADVEGVAKARILAGSAALEFTWVNARAADGARGLTRVTNRRRPALFLDRPCLLLLRSVAFWVNGEGVIACPGTLGLIMFCSFFVGTAGTAINLDVAGVKGALAISW